jgi:hypothetical protein
MIEDPTKSTRELFVEELRKSYDKGWEVKNTLETKANNIITISGTVASLLFGFGTLFLKNLDPHYQLLPEFVGLLVGGIIISIVAILFSSLSFRLRKYEVPIGPDFFANNQNLIDDFKTAKTDTFNNTMITAYLRCMEQNNKQNDGKVRVISIAQWSFFVSMIVIPILLTIAVHAIQAKAITFPILT